MVFEKKDDTGMRYIKIGNWYVVLTPTNDGTKSIFQAQYYEDGLVKIEFEVSTTYSFSKLNRTKLKKDETEIVIKEVEEFLEKFREAEELEEKKKKLHKSK